MSKYRTIRIITIALLMMTIIGAAFFMTGCTHAFECDICHKSVTESGHKVTVRGHEYEYCEECQKKLDSIKKSGIF